MKSSKAIEELAMFASEYIMIQCPKPPGGHLTKIPHKAQQNNHVLGVNLELSALQSDI